MEAPQHSGEEVNPASASSDGHARDGGHWLMAMIKSSGVPAGLVNSGQLFCRWRVARVSLSSFETGRQRCAVEIDAWWNTHPLTCHSLFLEDVPSKQVTFKPFSDDVLLFFPSSLFCELISIRSDCSAPILAYRQQSHNSNIYQSIPFTSSIPAPCTTTISTQMHRAVPSNSSIS